mgnify:CR=1 FL=1
MLIATIATEYPEKTYDDYKNIFIKLGIKNCEESEGYMFFVGDQPLLDKKDIEIEFKRDNKFFSKIFSNNKSVSQKDNFSQEKRGLSLSIFS